jgi:hypothetical protein
MLVLIFFCAPLGRDFFLSCSLARYISLALYIFDVACNFLPREVHLHDLAATSISEQTIFKVIEKVLENRVHTLNRQVQGNLTGTQDCCSDKSFVQNFTCTKINLFFVIEYILRTFLLHTFCVHSYFIFI